MSDDIPKVGSDAIFPAFIGGMARLTFFEQDFSAFDGVAVKGGDDS